MSADARIARFDTRSNSKVSATEPKRADLTDEMSFVLLAWRSQRFTANIPTIAATASSRQGSRSLLAKITSASG
jgi:hypothetical protein